jgi:HlyD family secretion protein
VDAYPDRIFSGFVLQIRKAPEVVQNVVTYTTIVSAPNPDLLLLPGMTAQLRIVVSNTGEILKIPSQALRFRPNAAGPVSGHKNANQAASSKALLEGALDEGQQVIIGIANSQKQRGYFGVRLGF